MALTAGSLCLFRGPLWLRDYPCFFASIPFAGMGLALSLLAGCGIDGTEGTGGDVAQAKAINGSKNATISLSPIKITFSATQNGGNLPEQAVAVSNAGTGRFSWGVSADVSWLAISPTSGTGAGSFTAQIIGMDAERAAQHRDLCSCCTSPAGGA